MAKLIIIKGANSGTSYKLDKAETILGRSPDIQIVLNDPRSSRKHTRILKIGNEFYVEDMQSQNGTFLNGRKIKGQVKLNNNDNLCVGITWFSFNSDENSLQEGGIFYGYKIGKKLAEDTTGTMFSAYQEALKRNVLLWVLSFKNLGQEVDSKQKETARNSFVNQISGIANLFHRNIMMLMDFGAQEEYFYCSFEEVNLNSNVREYLQKNPEISRDKIFNIATQVAGGLKHAHEHGILHCHLTSKNVIIQREQYDRVIITELGVSRFLSESTMGNLTKTTGILGVSEYIAPEQITGEVAPSIQTDIYSYGCLLYHLLSCKVPFPAATPYEMAKAHLEGTPASLKECRKDIPESLSMLVERCMKKKPEERYPSFDVILEELRKTQADPKLHNIYQAPEAKSMLKEVLGEIVVKKWWLILPLVSIILGTLFFFLAPWLLGDVLPKLTGWKF